MRRAPRDHTQARKEVGHSAAVAAFQRLQGRWAVKDRGGKKPPMPDIANKLRRGMLWKQRDQAQAAHPSSSKESRASGLFFHSCCTPQARKKIHQEAAAFISAPQEHPQMSFLL